MYVRGDRQLGINLAVVPVAVSVAQNTKNLWATIKSWFGSDVIWGLQPDEFEQRHNDAVWFRNLWNKGYFYAEGRSEIPSGMTIQDYYVNRFLGGPMWPSYGGKEKLAFHLSHANEFRLGRAPSHLSSLSAGWSDLQWEEWEKYIKPVDGTATSSLVVETTGDTTGLEVASLGSSLPYVLIGGIVLWLFFRE